MTTPSVPWSFNGPLNAALRFVNFQPGHSATLQLSYQPSAQTSLAIQEVAARELAGALVKIWGDGPAVGRYRKLKRESLRCANAVSLAERDLRDALARQREAGAVTDKARGLGRRLVKLAAEVREAEAAVVQARNEAAAVAPVVAQARADAERELAAAAAFQSSTAVAVLNARRREVLEDLLTQIGDRLTALIGIDDALLKARAGADLRGSGLLSLHLDSPVDLTTDDADDEDEEEGDGEADEDASGADAGAEAEADDADAPSAVPAK